MSAATLTALIARCRSLCRPRLQVEDAELLRRFAQRREAAAFEELLERYAPLVWGVCRRMLTCEADCEDAFQATFLALVRKPGAIDPSQALGGWLHTVAVRVIRKTQLRARRQRPQAMLPERATAGDVAEEVGSRELFRIVDEEIERLPALLRMPLVICGLQGRTRDEAAAALGCSIAAVKSRLERGRELLRRSLQRRGVQLPAAFLVLGLTSERIRAALWAKTIQSVLHTPAPAIAALAEAGVSAIAIGKYKLILAALLVVSSAAGVVGTLMTEKPAETSASPQAKPAAVEAKNPQAPQVRPDRHGDPLPNGALARLGTVRWKHGFFVYNLAYSPDGKMIASVGAGRAIVVWDAATGKEIHQFPNDSQPGCVAFSPDGKILATGGNYSFPRLWDVSSGKELRQIGAGNFAFSPDGKLVTTGRYDDKTNSWDESRARIWDVHTGKEVSGLDCTQGKLDVVVAYSPDGKLLAVAGKDGSIGLWDPAAGTKRKQLIGHTKEVRKVVFSADSARLASASDDGSIRLWNLATGKHLSILAEKPGEYVRKPLAFSPDGTLLAGGCDDGTIRLWDVNEGAEKRRWQAGALAVQAMAFSPDGKTLVSGAAWDGIRLWDMATGQERHPSDGHRGFVDLLRFAADGKSLISIGRDRNMLEWDLATQTLRRRFTWTGTNLTGRALSPDGNTLAAGAWPDHAVRLWDVQTGKPRRLLGKPQKPVWAIAFSPDGRLVACGGDDHVIDIWEAGTGQEVRQIAAVPNRVMSLCFSPDSKALACGTWTEPLGKGSAEPTLHLWELAGGKEPCRFDIHAPIGFALAFSPDGKVLANGDDVQNDPMVRLWDTATGKELCRHKGHRDDVLAVAFSPDGKLVASGAGSAGRLDNSVHVWEAATGRLIRRFAGHHSCVGSIAFAPDGLTVASGAGDSTILLWDITGRRGEGRWHTKPLTPRQLDAYWTMLADTDAARAYDAVWALAAAPEQTIPFLRKHLPPVPQPDAKRVARLIADLDSDDFPAREKASKELSKLGNAIAPELQQALQSKPSAEAHRRIQQLLDQSRDWTAERLRDHRAIQALEHIGTRQAKEMLERLTAGAPDAPRTEEAKAALQRRLK